MEVFDPILTIAPSNTCHDACSALGTLKENTNKNKALQWQISHQWWPALPTVAKVLLQSSFYSALARTRQLGSCQAGKAIQAHGGG